MQTETIEITGLPPGTKTALEEVGRSLLAEENEAIVEAFLAGHPDFRLVPAGEALAAQRVPLEMGETLRLDPLRHGTDGFFAAVLERRV